MTTLLLMKFPRASIELRTWLSLIISQNTPRAGQFWTHWEYVSKNVTVKLAYYVIRQSLLEPPLGRVDSSPSSVAPLSAIFPRISNNRTRCYHQSYKLPPSGLSKYATMVTPYYPWCSARPALLCAILPMMLCIVPTRQTVQLHYHPVNRAKLAPFPSQSAKFAPMGCDWDRCTVWWRTLPLMIWKLMGCPRHQGWCSL